MLQVTWIDRRGAGRMRTFATAEECWEFISILRAEATVRDAQGEIVGEVQWRRKGECDDQRRRWVAWIEKSAS